MARTPILLILVTLLVACSPEEFTQAEVSPDPNPTSLPLRAPAPVESVEIAQDGSFPVRISVIARGHFPNECTSLDQIRQERRGGSFFIVIDSVQYDGEACLENRVAFEESIELDLEELPAGIYVVDVNGLQGTFKLQRDNIQDDGNAVVGGFVWHDRCDLTYPVDGGDVEISEGCVDVGDGRFRGDGIRAADEPGIEGVKVQLGAGSCPSTGLATTLTAPDGTFLFSGLVAGEYCLTLDGVNEQDSLLAADGSTAYLDATSGQQSISLQPGDSKLDVWFGYSPVQLPAEPVFFATPDADCTNKALFDADVTIPDDTPFSPGETFTKTWRLQNLGSCTWDSTYSLISAAGEQLGAPNSVPLTITVQPGDYGELSIQFVAPESPGTYRGEWKLADDQGNLFGIGPGSDQAFWVQIIVIEEEPRS